MKTQPELSTAFDIIRNNRNSLRINCPDDDHEFSININRAIFGFSIDEAKKIVKFLKDHIKNEETNP